MKSISNNKVSMNELQKEAVKKAKQEKAQDDKSVFDCPEPTKQPTGNYTASESMWVDPTSPTDPSEAASTENNKGLIGKFAAKASDLINSAKDAITNLFNKEDEAETTSIPTDDSVTENEETIIQQCGKKYREVEVTHYAEDGVIEVTKELQEIREEKEKVKTHEETVTITVFEDDKVTDILIETREVPDDISEMKTGTADATDVVYPTEPVIEE